ncbi:MAG: LysR family transcriptional regulator [Pseudomonadales bacterium]|nr:LysR family transcriptional regulator [Pseudomonadales bacterium]
MNQQNLETFIVVARTQSFTRTSELLHLTQPAISKRIQNIEQELNVVLFDRVGKNVMLTQAGQVFAQHAEQLIQAFKNCHIEMDNIQQQVSGKLNMGVSHHIGLHRLPSILKQFALNYPEVQLSISFLDSDEAYKQVAQGHVEFALATLNHSQQQFDALQQRPLWVDSMQFCVNAGHELDKLRQQKNLNLHDLAEFPAILPKASTFTGNLVQAAFLNQDAELQKIIETNYLETIKMMTSIGLGWSVLPASMIDSELVSLKLNNKSLTRDLGLITHQERSLSNASKAFISMLPKSLTQ